jgi:hypothetical protein
MRDIKDIDEVFVWGFIAGIGCMLIQQASRKFADWFIDQCAHPKVSLNDLKLIHEKDQQEASSE